MYRVEVSIQPMSDFGSSVVTIINRTALMWEYRHSLMGTVLDGRASHSNI